MANVFKNCYKSKTFRRGLATIIAIARIIMAIYSVVYIFDAEMDSPVVLSIFVVLHDFSISCCLAPLFRDNSKNTYTRVYFFLGLLLGTIFWAINLADIASELKRERWIEKCERRHACSNDPEVFTTYFPWALFLFFVLDLFLTLKICNRWRRIFTCKDPVETSDKRERKFVKNNPHVAATAMGVV